MAIYTKQEIADLCEGGKLLSAILSELVTMVKPGAVAFDLDAYAQKRMAEVGGVPSFLNYRTSPRDPAFPSAVCISVNDEVVHGIANQRVFNDGDLVKLDIGMRYKNLCTDMAVSVPCGNVSPAALALARATRESLVMAIAKCNIGNWVSDIGKTVDKFIKRQGYTTVKDLTGHGVGHKVHEDPIVPNYFEPGYAPVKLVDGLVIAIEPMINLGGDRVKVSKRDGWTVSTYDGSLSAHFEATIAITTDGPIVVTPIPEVPGL